jgi:N-methylhydantoinase A/oxoprolinase/acetone carboxylase beta subunit
MATIREMVEECIDSLKISNQDVDVILVGGGSIVLPKKLAGTSTVYNPAHFGCANAIGSAISKVSGNYEQLIDYNQIPREQALEQAKADAVKMAVAAGAVEGTVEIIEVEDVPLAYCVGNTCRVRVKAAGDLA